MEAKPSNSKEVAIEFPFFRLFKDRTIDRFFGDPFLPPSPDSESGVKSKDVVISPQTGVTARIFLPQIPDPTRKLPLLIYYHGGAFCVGSPFSPPYSQYAPSLAEQANVVVLSVHYRRAPEDLLPTAFDDAWDAVKWAAAHSGGNGPESWINQFADLNKVFLGGDSAGATLAHNVAIRAGVDGLSGPKLMGMVLFHPYFGNDKPDKMLEVIFPTCEGVDDPRVNPSSDPNLVRLGCLRVLIFVAEKDFLRKRGWSYYEALKKSGWSGVVEIVETEDENHVFHLFDPTSEKAQAMMKKTVSILNQAQAHI
ncbi:2-hydroxyisoflavanone dehydratase [Cannabis sativa]|uniref:2-hydroxyisoflavanone dehydratase n=1 Tax=Cannabis sativa TaxID=3483 RepID=UPI0029CA9F20|nr:2-hydroxyisoflavanone dehydratase [Cannabis sativa]